MSSEGVHLDISPGKGLPSLGAELGKNKKTNKKTSESLTFPNSPQPHPPLPCVLSPGTCGRGGVPSGTASSTEAWGPKATSLCPLSGHREGSPAFGQR